jgi:hypothetical protein
MIVTQSSKYDKATFVETRPGRLRDAMDECMVKAEAGAAVVLS